MEHYRTAYQAWNGLRKQIAALEMDEAERSRRVDTLNFQIRELERAQLRAGEDEELDQRRTLLRSAGKLMDALQSAEYALCGDDEGGGVCSLLADAEGELDSVSQFSAALEELARQVSELRSAADDAADTLRDLTREMEFSPGELDEVESRLDILYRLKKKYGATVEEMLQYLDKCRKELDEINLLTIPLPGSRKNWTRLERKRTGRHRPCPSSAARRRRSWKSGSRRNCGSWICRKCVSRWNFPHR